MVFPSLPIYLDPPNWSQQQPNQQAGIGIQNPQIPPPPLQPPPLTVAAVGGGGCYQGSIRPGSMADRARLAKIHQPDMALKCPRCESTNTKFCYYNNYSLSQPRHFCKTCRRYWTRGGALRNVPVGGGCRRNKRSKGTTSNTNKSSISKSPNMKPGSSSQSANSNSSSGCTNNNNNNNINDVMGHNLQTPPTTTQLPLFFPNTLHHHHYSTNGGEFVFGANPSSLVGRNGNSTTSDHEFQWRLPNLQQVQQNQHFPNFLMTTNLESQQVGLFHQFEGENNNGGFRFRSSNNNNKGMDDCGVGGIIPNEVINNVKMEGNNNQGLSLSKNVGNDVFWSIGNGNAWSSEEVPSFTNSSTSHLL